MFSIIADAFQATRSFFIPDIQKALKEAGHDYSQKETAELVARFAIACFGSRFHQFFREKIGEIYDKTWIRLQYLNRCDETKYAKSISLMSTNRTKKELKERDLALLKFALPAPEFGNNFNSPPVNGAEELYAFLEKKIGNILPPLNLLMFSSARSCIYVEDTWINWLELIQKWGEPAGELFCSNHPFSFINDQLKPSHLLSLPQKTNLSFRKYVALSTVDAIEITLKLTFPDAIRNSLQILFYQDDPRRKRISYFVHKNFPGKLTDEILIKLNVIKKLLSNLADTDIDEKQLLITWVFKSKNLKELPTKFTLELKMFVNLLNNLQPLFDSKDSFETHAYEILTEIASLPNDKARAYFNLMTACKKSPLVKASSNQMIEAAKNFGWLYQPEEKIQILKALEDTLKDYKITPSKHLFDFLQKVGFYKQFLKLFERFLSSSPYGGTFDGDPFFYHFEKYFKAQLSKLPAHH